MSFDLGVTFGLQEQKKGEAKKVESNRYAQGKKFGILRALARTGVYPFY